MQGSYLYAADTPEGSTVQRCGALFLVLAAPNKGIKQVSYPLIAGGLSRKESLQNPVSGLGTLDILENAIISKVSLDIVMTWFFSW